MKPLCILPWISLEASPIGTVRPCCLAEDEIVDSNSVKFNLKTADFKSIQNSEYMYQLRQSMLAGRRPATCRKCWSEEDAGRTSKRMHTLDRLKHVVTDQEWTQEAKPLMFLDLKLGNICNLKCRICGSWSSSTYASEEIKFLPPEEKKSSFHYQMLKAGAWPRENESFWNEIDTVLTDIRYIEFTGGEPFMISEHFDMLQGMVDRGIAHQVEIHYNTNGTVFPDRGPDIWRHFKTVEVAFSIDDIGARFEYQRAGANWNEVKDNIDRFRELQTSMPQLQLQCCSTVNVFNVMYLEDLDLFHELIEFDFVYWNMMHEAYYFSIGSLPDTAKQLVRERLERADVSEKTRKEFEKIIQFMMQGQSLDGTLTRERIAEVDQRRGQHLSHHHSELAQAIGYHNG